MEWRAGGRSLRSPWEAFRPSVTPSHRNPAPRVAAPCPHLGLQLCQPGLAPQQLGLELGSAILKLRLRSQQLLLVFRAQQQALCQGLREQGLQEEVRHVPG